MRPVKRLLILCLLVGVSSKLLAASSGHLLAFAIDNRLTLALGKFEPGQGWVQNTDYYAPPQPGDPFTLYTPAGKVAVVTIQEKRRPVQDDTFAGWTAQVSRWNNRSNPFALAVAGTDPLSADPVEFFPSDNPEFKAVVSKYLKTRGLSVDQPYLTQVFNIPIEGHGREEVILMAHSDAKALTTEKEAAVYAVALLWWNDHGKEEVLPLACQTSFKPAGRTREEHEHLYGTRDFLRLVAALDIDGDGWKEIVLYDAKDDATEIDVFSFDGRRLRKVLSTYKPNYN
jgi:hypothetical protein